MNAQQQVQSLLEQMKGAAPEAHDKLTCQILVLTRGYMEPCEDLLPAVKLSPNERKLFGLLHSRLGRAVARGALLDAASYHHGWDTEPHAKVIDVYICHLRRKLKDSGFEIETVWGLGYRLKSKQEQAKAAA